jgi:Flp pilus assembly protein TadD
MLSNTLTDEQATTLHLLGYVNLQNGRPDRAAVLFAALDVLQPGRPEILRALALAQIRRQAPQQALDTLDKLAMTTGVNAGFHLLRARALAQMDRNEEASAAMKSYLHLREA